MTMFACYNCGEVGRVVLARTRAAKDEIIRQYHCGGCDVHWSTEETLRIEKGGVKWRGKGLSESYLIAHHLANNAIKKVRKGRRIYTSSQMRARLMGEVKRDEVTVSNGFKKFVVNVRKDIAQFDSWRNAVRHAKLNGYASIYHGKDVSRIVDGKQLFVNVGAERIEY